jgi:dolichol-phosphate mannosyltransferase
MECSGSSSPSVSVVVPTYNEAQTIGSLIRSLKSETARLHPSIVIVDDGSMDGTREEAQLAGDSIGVTIIERGRRMGLGTAISDGFRAALYFTPDYIVTMDADLSHQPVDLPRLVGACGVGTLTIGSRYIEGGKSPGLGTGRRLVSLLGNWAAREGLALPVHDCTSGFRCYHHDVVESILPKLRSQGYDIQIETLYRSIKEGYKVVEIPIEFSPRRGGKSKLEARETIRFFKTISSLKTNEYSRRY